MEGVFRLQRKFGRCPSGNDETHSIISTKAKQIQIQNQLTSQIID